MEELVCGLDLGSRSVKMVLLARDGAIKSAKVMETAAFYRHCGRREADGFRVGLDVLGGVAPRVVATGYGRNTAGLAGATVLPELKAHVLGAVFQTGLEDFTLLDLGGQDSKVIKVRRGRMVDFDTNDKCAASTGRYLENMAAVLGIDLEELSRYGDNPVELSSTCAIFGESELIGRIAEGYGTAELAAGVNHTILRRIKPMLKRLKSDTLVFTGGVAWGRALRRLLEQELGVAVVVPAEPQLNGAIGCARHGFAQVAGRR